MSRTTADATMDNWTDLEMRQRYKSLEKYTSRLELVMTNKSLADELRTEYEDCLRSIGASLGTTALNNDIRGGLCCDSAPEAYATYDTRLQAVGSKALKIQLVLEPLSQYLSHKELKTCRLVCADWNNWLKPRLFNNSKLVLRFYSSWKDMLQTMEWETILAAFPIRSAKNAWKNLGKFGTSRSVGEKPKAFSIPKSIELLDFKPSENIFEWLTYFNEQIKCLKMDIDCPTWYRNRTEGRHKTKVYKGKMMVELLTVLPNLEELQLSTPFKGSLLQEGSDAEFIQLPKLKALIFGPIHCWSGQFDPSSLKELLCSPKNLQTLSLVHCPTHVTEYFQVCQDVGYLESLTELNLSLAIDQRALGMLSLVKFKHLKKLSLLSLRHDTAGDGYPNELTFLGQLLENVSHSLEVLKLSAFSPKSLFAFDDKPQYALHNVDFPEMKKLKSLEVQDLQERDNFRIDLVKKFPNLHSIRLNSRDLSAYGREEEPSASLTYSIFPGSGMLKYRNHWIKNIDLGNLTVGNHALGEIANHLTAVESIRLRYPRTNTMYFDNISVSFVRWLGYLNEFEHLKELAITCEVMCESHFNYGVRKALPDFKVLRKFTFDCEKCKVRLHEKTVLQGIMKAPSLQFLELRNILIDQDCYENIRKQLGKKLREVRFVECYIAERLTSSRMTPRAKKASAFADEAHHMTRDDDNFVYFKECGWYTNNWNMELKGNPGFEV